MAEVKWIKLYTEVFSNRKIKQIRNLPEGDAINGVWFQILCLAGQTNDNGLVYFSKDIPYTDEMLATEFERPLNIIRLSLITFERFNMIEIFDNILLVSNWEKYQSNDKLQQIREDTKNRVAKHREKQKLLASKAETVTQCNADVTQCNATELELELELDNNIWSDFNTFWKAYPKKKSKGDAERAYKKIKPDEKLLGVMLEAIEQSKKSVDWLKDNGQFIPYPASWLNSKCWEDETSEVIEGRPGIHNG